jgi:glycosyltransferase involved in cell wall biosynthesis
LTGISIGLPVYNGEKTLRKAIESILDQTYSDFELIISDNASTDNTSTICNEYVKKDSRIKYFRQEKNIDILKNFRFVLEKASYNYFAWIASDDFWEKENIEENLKILLIKKNVVCSIGKQSEWTDNSAPKDISSKILIKLRSKYLNEKYQSISGSYDHKVKKYLKNSMCDIYYGFHRTACIKESFVMDKFVGNDWATNLNILKLGEVYIINKKLWQKNLIGISSKGMNETLDSLHKGTISKNFPYYKFSLWCIKNLGTKNFIKNFNYFIFLNISGIVSRVLDLINKIGYVSELKKMNNEKKST